MEEKQYAGAKESVNRDTHFSEATTNHLFEFLLSDDDEKCWIPADQRHERYREFTSQSTVLNRSNRKQRIRLIALYAILQISGITLKDLLDKMIAYQERDTINKIKNKSIKKPDNSLAEGIDSDAYSKDEKEYKYKYVSVYGIELTDPADLEFYTLLSKFPVAHPFLKSLNAQTSLMVSDFFVHEEILKYSPTIRFYYYRLQNKTGKEQKKLDNEMIRIFIEETDRIVAWNGKILKDKDEDKRELGEKAYNRFIDPHHYSSINPEYLPLFADKWHLSHRWLYDLPKGCCALLQDEDADMALSNFMSMGEANRKICMDLLKRGAKEYGV